MKAPAGRVVLLLAACAGPGSSSPGPAPASRPDWTPVTRYLDSALAAGAAPGAVLAVSVAGRRFYHGAGRLGLDDPSRPGPTTVYDLASLTKVVALTPLMAMAVDDGRIELDAPVARYVPHFGGLGKDGVTVRMLLAHAGGLPAWRPFFRQATSRAQLLALADATPLEAAPGTREVYSDIGVIVLTQALESVYGRRIDSLAAERVFGPLGMRSTRYLPPADWRGRIAPTEEDPWRGRLLRGEVHDENAAAMDGVSGHAGLFSDAADLLTYGEWVLGRGSSGSAGEFTRRAGLVPGSTRALGWDTPSPGGSAGSRLSPRSIGHTGFTGTSLWIDPDHRLVIVLLSNRVHPTRDNPRWAPVRARVADLVTTTLFEAHR